MFFGLPEPHHCSSWCWITCPGCFIRTKEQKINVRDCGELSFDYLMSEDSTSTEPYCRACFIRNSPAMSQGHRVFSITGAIWEIATYKCCVARSLNHQSCSTKKTVLNECLEGEGRWKRLGIMGFMAAMTLDMMILYGFILIILDYPIPHVSRVDKALFLWDFLMWYS